MVQLGFNWTEPETITLKCIKSSFVSWQFRGKSSKQLIKVIVHALPNYIVYARIGYEYVFLMYIVVKMLHYSHLANSS